MNFIELLNRIDKENENFKFKLKGWKKGHYVTREGGRFVTEKGKPFNFPKITYFNDLYRLTWEEYMEPILTDWEKEQLRKGQAPFGSTWDSISKIATDPDADFDLFYLYKSDEIVGRFNIPKSNHFLQMKENKKYTWKELNLFDKD